MHTERGTTTQTITCPNLNKPKRIHGEAEPDQDVEGPCEGEREVSIAWSYSPEERATMDYPGAPADLQVDATADPCEWCGHVLTPDQLHQIEQDFTPDTPERDEP